MAEPAHADDAISVSMEHARHVSHFMDRLVRDGKVTPWRDWREPLGVRAAEERAAQREDARLAREEAGGD